MSMTKNRLAALTGAAVLLATTLAHGTTPLSVLEQLPIPPESRVNPISGHTVQNGMRISMATIHSSQPLDAVIVFYRNHWFSTGALSGATDAIEHSVGRWTVLGKLQDGHSVVIQLASETSQGTHGYLSATPLVSTMGIQDRTQPEGSAFAGNVFAQSTVLSRTQSTDNGVRSDLRLYASTMPVTQVGQYFIDGLIERDWQPVWHGQQSSRRFAVLERGNRTLELMIMASDDGLDGIATKIVANEVTK